MNNLEKWFCYSFMIFCYTILLLQFIKQSWVTDYRTEILTVFIVGTVGMAFILIKFLVRKQ